jgi:hypothetical protein
VLLIVRRRRSARPHVESALIRVTLFQERRNPETRAVLKVRGGVREARKTLVTTSCARVPCRESAPRRCRLSGVRPRVRGEVLTLRELEKLSEGGSRMKYEGHGQTVGAPARQSAGAPEFLRYYEGRFLPSQ